MAYRKRLTDAALSLAMPVALAAPVLLAAPAEAQSSAADLRILSPRAGDSLDLGTFALDVSFKSRSNAPITTAELWVDGTRWIRRDLTAPQLKNVLSFDVDASTMSEGNHTFVVRVFDADGATSEKAVTVQLSGHTTAPVDTAGFGPEMKFLTLSNNSRVSGVLEVQLEALPRNGINPYVTFYVDKQFKTLKNYPPYSFNWDTTTVENGYHTIEAMGYLDSNNSSTTRRLRVLVDNPGGNTTVKTDIPDLAKARQQSPVTAVTAASKPLTIPIRKSSATVAKSAALLVANGLNAMHGDLVPAPKSDVQALTARVKSSVRPLTVDILPTVTPRAIQNTTSPRMVKPAATAMVHSQQAVAFKTVEAMMTTARGVQATTSRVIASPTVTSTVKPMTSAMSVTAPTRALTSLSRPTAVTHFVQPKSSADLSAVKNIASGIRMATPSVASILSAPVAAMRVTLAQPVQNAITPIKLPKTSLAKPRIVVRPNFIAQDLRMMKHPLQIAMDGQQIAFDVQPRVEHGLPIAPFRNIFQHTGGQVMWINETKTVRAVNTDREIVFSLGRKSARINGENVTMERAATIEHGRSIVPLSFVKDALDVNIKYDPATGHLDITSKN